MDPFPPDDWFDDDPDEQTGPVPQGPPPSDMPITDDDIPPEVFEDIPPEAYDDVPPEAYDDYDPTWEQQSPPAAASNRAAKNPPGTVIDGAEASSVIRQVIRATDGLSAVDARSILSQITTDRIVIDLCEPAEKKALLKVADGLIAETSLLEDTDPFDLFRLDVRFSKDAWRALQEIQDMDVTTDNPGKLFAAAAESAQLNRAIKSAVEFYEACQRQERAEKLISLHRKIEAPTRRQSLDQADFLRSASEWIDHRTATAGDRTAIRLSSGLRSMDLALTQPGLEPGTFAEPLGSFGPGEFWVFPAGTGHGKSAFARPLATSLLLDLWNWGLTDAKVLLAFVEETPNIIISAGRIDEGDPYNHVAKNLLLANVGASRRRFVEAGYRAVMQAEDQARSTGRPITQFLPWVFILDYIGGPKETGETDAQAIETNADLLLRGFANWNPDDMALFSGLDYRTYSGRSWPEGMENFRPIVIMFAQLLSKIDGPKIYGPKEDPGMFSVQNPDGSWGWELKHGDERVPTQNHIRGSSVLVNHATGVVFLHRSRPQKNPPVYDPAIGKRRLMDTRSRLIFDKVRNGSTTAFVPMAFDSNPKGNRGMWYDTNALEALRRGFLRDVTDDWTAPGDPMLPIRPTLSPFSSRY